MFKKSIFCLLLIFTLPSLCFGISNNLVHNKFKFNAVYGVDDEGKPTKIIADEHLRGKFTFIWFFHDSCPYRKKSLNALKDVVEWIDKNYINEMNVMFTHVEPRDLEVVRNYFAPVYLNNRVISRLDEFRMIEYMNLESTPTLIILDPYLNIVDKIENTTDFEEYTKHIRYIISKFKERKGL